MLRWHVRNASLGPVESTSASANVSVRRQSRVRPPTRTLDLPSASRRALGRLAWLSRLPTHIAYSGSGRDCQQLVLRQGWHQELPGGTPGLSALNCGNTVLHSGLSNSRIPVSLARRFRVCSVCVCQSLSRVQLCNPMECSPPGSSVHGIYQARILEWVAISSSRKYCQPRD